MNKLNIKTSDTVVVISGEDRKKQGKVLSVNPETRRIVVQNVNMVTCHVKPRRQGQPGGRIEKEGTIHVSNVMLVCPSCHKPTRVGHTIKNGKKYRTCKKCNKLFD